MVKSNQDLARELLALVGGKENIRSATNCMTRVRLDLADKSKAKTAEIKTLDGVLGIVDEDGLQIVVGPGKAKKVLDILTDELGVARSGSTVGDWKANKAALKAGQKKSGLKTALKTIGEIFMPLIPAIIAAGIFNGFASLFTQITPKDSTVWKLIITLLQLFGGSFLAYFAIFTGINAAKKFGATEALGGMLGAMSIMTQINTISEIFGLFNKDIPLNSVLTTGKGGIIGVIFGVWVLAKVERYIRKKIPDVLDIILTPLIALMIVGTLFVIIIMPVAGFVSDGLVIVLSALVASTNPVVSVISGFILSAVFLPMVLLGLHHGLIPIYAVQLQAMGGVTLFPVLAMAGAGQVGAAIAIYLKAKKVRNKRLQSVITGALPAGFLGIGEPLIYGVTLPLGKPFVTAGIGAGFGGAFVMLMNVMATAWGPSGLVAIPLMKPESMLYYFLGLVISYIGGFIVTSLAIKDSEIANV